MIKKSLLLILFLFFASSRLNCGKGQVYYIKNARAQLLLTCFVAAQHNKIIKNKEFRESIGYLIKDLRELNWTLEGESYFKYHDFYQTIGKWFCDVSRTSLLLFLDREKQDVNDRIYRCSCENALDKRELQILINDNLELLFLNVNEVKKLNKETFKNNWNELAEICYESQVIRPLATEWVTGGIRFGVVYEFFKTNIKLFDFEAIYARFI